MFELSTSQRYGNGEVGVEENPQVIVSRFVSITISNSSRFVARVFLSRYDNGRGKEKRLQ